jgi:hypothetical protein
MNYLFRSKSSTFKHNIQSLKYLTNKHSCFISKHFSSDINPFSNNEKSKSKFTKVSNQTLSNLPLEEENLANLLSDMKTLESKAYQNHLVQKNEILFFANPDESMREVKLGQFIRINNTTLAQCFSIKDNLYTFLALNKQK